MDSFIVYILKRPEWLGRVSMDGVDVDLSKAEVLDSNPYTATRCMLESWHIQRNENKLNRERGNLPEVYTALLE